MAVVFDLIGDIKVGKNGTLSLNGYGVAIDALLKEYHATNNERRFLFMLSDPEEGEEGVPSDLKGVFLFVVDKTTRETIAALPAKKKPNDKVDPWNRLVWFNTDNKRIDCYPF
jgi:hypothetical protein